MKIQYCSDLHLEFSENKDFLKQYPIEPIGEILLLAGNILPFALHKQPCEFIDFVADNFEAVYWIPGNHEYYHFDLGTVTSPLFEKFRENVFLINNQTITYKNTNIVCSTLWSNISAAKTILITHYVPTLMNYPAQYKGSNINEAFAVELHGFIENSNLPYWIYGHHHCSTAEFKIGKTALLTNQLGYVKYNEHKFFNPSAIIEL